MKRRGLRARAVSLTRSEWADWTLLASVFALAHALLALYAR